MAKVFRITRLDISEANKNNPYILNARIEQRYNILFGLFHYWSSPSFAPPHLFHDDQDAVRYIKSKYPNAIVYDNYTGNTCQ